MALHLPVLPHVQPRSYTGVKEVFINSGERDLPAAPQRDLDEM